MDISTRHLAAAGVALLSAGAVAFTPVGPSLQGLILRNQTVAPIEAALLPNWLTQGAADLAERIAGSPEMPPGADRLNDLPVPLLPAAVAGLQLPGVITDEVATSPLLNAIPEEVLRASAANAMPTQSDLADLFVEFESLVNTAVTPVVGAVTGAITSTVGELARILSAAAADAMSIIVLTVPLLVAGRLVDAVTSLVNTWLELRDDAGAVVHLGPVPAPDPLGAPASPRSAAVPVAVRTGEAASMGTDSGVTDVARASTPGDLQPGRHRPRPAVAARHSGDDRIAAGTGGVTGVGPAGKQRSISATAAAGAVAAAVASAHGHSDTPADTK